MGLSRSALPALPARARHRAKRVGVVIAAAVLLGASLFVAGAVLRPMWVRKAWMQLTAPSRWDELNRLGRLLSPGMTDDEVTQVLGPPWKTEEYVLTPDEAARLPFKLLTKNSAQMIVWMYYDGQRCAGDELYLEFLSGGPQGPMYLLSVRQGHEAVLLGPPSKEHREKYYVIGAPIH